MAAAMVRSQTRLLLTGWLCAGLLGLVLSAPACGQATPTSTADSLQPWIEEVRAQRQALAERRHDYHKARRRAHEETLNANHRRHEQQRQRIIEHFTEPVPPPYPPGGWDNHWYYRGW